MADLVLPAPVLKKLAKQAATQVVEAVNSYEGRERLSVSRITPVDDEQFCFVWQDDQAPPGDELKGIWELSTDVDKMIELIINSGENLHGQ